MSSESIKSDNNNSEEAIHLFILRTTAGSMKAPIQYLQHRNWIVGSSANLREALTYILTKKPQYVMVAADHPNRKVKILPRLLMQAMPLQVIAFMERSTVAARQLLSEVGVEHQIFPPTSGPGVERMILKIRKEQEESGKSSDRQIFSSGTGEASSDVRVFAGGSGQDPSGAFGIQGSISQATSLLQQMLSSSEDGEEHGNHGGETSAILDPQIYIDKGDRKADGIGGIIEADPYSSDWKADQDGPAKAPLFSAGGSPQTESAGSGPRGEMPIEQERVRAQANKKSNQGNAKSNLIYNKNRQSLADGVDSIIVRGTSQALDESVSISSHDDAEKLDKTSNAACILVESPRFNGYLVAALGKNKKVDPEFVDTVKARLFSFLRAHGEIPKESDEHSMQIKLQEVEFEDWAIEQAEFLKKTVHGNDEVAMAFFPNVETKVNLEDSVSSKMLKMTIDDLKEDAPVEFDLYIYMPENNKYLLYTPEGKPFLKNQKDRLKEKGISHMHLRKESSGNVKKYRAQNFLNEKIEQFKAARKA